MACNFMGDEWFVDSLNQKVRQGSRPQGEAGCRGRAGVLGSLALADRRQSWRSSRPLRSCWQL